LSFLLEKQEFPLFYILLLFNKFVYNFGV